MSLNILTDNQVQDKFGHFSWSDDPNTKGAIKIRGSWASENIGSWHIPALKNIPTYGGKFGGNVRFHKEAALALQHAFDDVATKGLQDLLLFWGGSFVPRHINWNPARGLSRHSWGIAFDINVQWNGFGVTPPAIGVRGSVRQLVTIFAAHGFAWGGNFSSPDGMHFEYAR